MGVVYKAWDPHLECFVAIKFLSDNVISTPEGVELSARMPGPLQPSIISTYEGELNS